MVFIKDMCMQVRPFVRVRDSPPQQQAAHASRRRKRARASESDGDRRNRTNGLCERDMVARRGVGAAPSSCVVASAADDLSRPAGRPLVAARRRADTAFSLRDDDTDDDGAAAGQFFLAYRDDTQGGRLVQELSLIRRNYVCGWFPVDFLSVVPFDVIGLKQLKTIRLIRLLRLLKV
jgi:hypothetical protein